MKQSATQSRSAVPGSRFRIQVSYLVMRLLFMPLPARLIGKQFGFDILLQGA